MGWMTQIDRRDDMQQETLNIIAHMSAMASGAILTNDAYHLHGCLKAIYPFVHMRLDPEEGERILRLLDQSSAQLYRTSDEGIPPEEMSEIFDDLYKTWLLFTRELHETGMLLKVRVPSDEIGARGLSR